MKWMVSLDGSKSAEMALRWAIRSMNKKTDQLSLISVTEITSNSVFIPAPGLLEALSQQQQFQEKESEQLLRKYILFARNLGVEDVHGFRSTAPSAGEMICRAAERKEIETLVIGRRGLSRIQRFLLGSVSRYCVEHATCSVVVVKQEVEEGRIAADLQEQKAEKFQSDLNRNISRLAEEAERDRRVKEEEGIIEKEKADRVAAHIGAVIDEEQERTRRTIEDVEVHHLPFDLVSDEQKNE